MCPILDFEAENFGVGNLVVSAEIFSETALQQSPHPELSVPHTVQTFRVQTKMENELTTPPDVKTVLSLVPKRHHRWSIYLFIYLFISSLIFTQHLSCISPSVWHWGSIRVSFLRIYLFIAKATR